MAKTTRACGQKLSGAKCKRALIILSNAIHDASLYFFKSFLVTSNCGHHLLKIHTKLQETMEVKDLYCYQCSIEFDKKFKFNDHLSDIHCIVFHERPVPDFQYLILSESQGCKTENLYKNEANGMKEKGSVHEQGEKTCKTHSTILETDTYFSNSWRQRDIQMYHLQLEICSAGLKRASKCQ